MSSGNILCRARNVLAIALIVLTASVIAGCSSGNSGGGGAPPPPPPPATGTMINGNVTAPGGMVVMLENQSFHYALLEVVFPSARADITGLQPVGGATVELIRVDNDGVQVGAVLASTTTSITGDYTLELPVGVDFAADLVVRITGAGTETLSAQVVEQMVDINPITDFILDKFVEGGTQLDTLAVGEVVRLRGQAEEFDLTAGADLSEMLAILEAEVGDFLEDEVSAVNADPGDGASVAGSYNSGLTNVGLFNDDLLDGSGIRNGFFSAGFSRSTFSIEDNGNGELTATFNSGEESDAILGINNNVPPDIFVVSDTFLDTEVETIPLTIDTNGVIRFSEPFEEELIQEDDGGGPGGIGIRTPPANGEIYPAGPDNDLFVLNDTFSEVRFDLTDTDDDGVDDAVDPDAQTGTGAVIDLEFFARTPSAFPSLDGDWGFVALEVGVSANGNIFAGVCLDANTISGNNSDMTSTTVSCQDVDRAPGAAGGLVLVEDTELDVRVLTPGTDGLISVMEVGGSIADEGFVDADGDFMALFFGDDIDDGGNPPTLINLERGAAFGVRLGATTPDLTGRSYRLLSQEIWFESTGAVTVSRVSGATLTFDSNVSATLSAQTIRTAVRASDVDGPTSVNEEIANSETVGVTLAADGAITFTLADGVVVDGFVSADRNLLLMRSTFVDAVDGDVDIGLVVGVPATP